MSGMDTNSIQTTENPGNDISLSESGTAGFLVTVNRMSARILICLEKWALGPLVAFLLIGFIGWWCQKFEDFWANFFLYGLIGCSACVGTEIMKVLLTPLSATNLVKFTLSFWTSTVATVILFGGIFSVVSLCGVGTPISIIIYRVVINCVLPALAGGLIGTVSTWNREQKKRTMLLEQKNLHS